MDEKERQMDQLLDRAGAAYQAANQPSDGFPDRIKAALRAEARAAAPPRTRTRHYLVAAAAILLVVAGYAVIHNWRRAERVELLFAQGSFPTANTTYSNGSTITSGPDGRAILQSDDGRVTLFLAAASNLTIDGEDRISLDRGELWVDITPKSGFYQVRTPNATVTVQGTRFGVRVAEDGTKVSIESGEVSIRAGDRTAALRPGNSAHVAASSNATELETAGAELPGWVTNLEQDFLRSAAARRYPSGWSGRRP